MAASSGMLSTSLVYWALLVSWRCNRSSSCAEGCDYQTVNGGKLKFKRRRDVNVRAEDAREIIKMRFDINRAHQKAKINFVPLPESHRTCSSVAVFEYNCCCCCCCHYASWNSVSYPSSAWMLSDCQTTQRTSRLKRKGELHGNLF